jgi:hypothetical protein
MAFPLSLAIYFRIETKHGPSHASVQIKHLHFERRATDKIV